ncbi:hypothetical protein BD310DRAFT_436761 [Dichomitus squalens]|uniref:Uncharacterized protein n=1 Tax=Dichomitus squalens TaxID=114155 RepID=A0A4Q9PWJ7_9APHY|nr:hypothetical protein BD310DRAFT_436761 [Dichomitus squalens]
MRRRNVLFLDETTSVLVSSLSTSAASWVNPLAPEDRVMNWRTSKTSGHPGRTLVGIEGMGEAGRRARLRLGSTVFQCYPTPAPNSQAMSHRGSRSDLHRHRGRSTAARGLRLPLTSATVTAHSTHELRGHRRSFRHTPDAPQGHRGRSTLGWRTLSCGCRTPASSRTSTKPKVPKTGTED